MPLYDFRCNDCGTDFEALMPAAAENTPDCLSCGSSNVEKRLSVPASYSGKTRNRLPGTGDTTCCGGSPGHRGCAGPGSCCGKA
ncbi:FmdB family zinc ribbon protein [Desulfatiglans anilini]|uniref:FmdB family zinc ribbon protein n=1 Tax=Desulfatiglans anilini TaxID=90728 RepID=UPI00041AB48E|nr:zinc ribbon domain-containing protein [Desulfatiglans anilini]